MTVKQALSILKPDGNTAGALKDSYRTAAMKYHPDKGGDPEIMKLVNNAYELLCRITWTTAQQAEAAEAVPLTEVMAELWEKFKHYPGLDGEICGSWLWITGDTRKYREDLKAAGFKFAAKKSAWYYHEDAYRKHSKRKFSMDEVRDLWGSSELDKDELRSVAV